MTLPLMHDSPGELRPYQQECIDALVSFRRTRTPAYPDGGQRALCTLPTGSGKTVIFSQFPKLSSKGVFIMMHREELIDQTVRKVRQWCPGYSVGVEQASSTASRTDRVVVASVQTLISGNRLAKFDPSRYSMFVLDEAHHGLAASFLSVFAHFGLAPNISDLREKDLDLLDDKKESSDPARRALRKEVRQRFESFRPALGSPFLVGVTATGIRTDGVALENIFDEVVYTKSMLDLMKDGYLCPIRGYRVRTDTDLSDVQVRRGADGKDFVQKELAKHVNTPERNSLVVQTWKELARDRRTIVFCADVQHAKDMLAMFRSGGAAAAMVVGATPTQERREVIEAYRRGTIQVLVNVEVASEGFDVPETACICIAKPTLSPVSYTQKIGRGTRPAAGKQDTIILDFVDAGKAGTIGVNNLFGLPPKLDVSGAGGVLQARRDMDEYEGKVPQHVLADVTTLSEVKAKIEDFNPLMAAEVEPEIRRASKLAWVKTSYGYSLGLFSGVQVGVVVDLLGHAVVRVKRPGEKPQQVGERHPMAALAIKAADEYADKSMMGGTGVLSRDAHWRTLEVTEGQVKYLKWLKRSGQLKAIPEGLNRGTARDLIDAVKGKSGEMTAGIGAETESEGGLVNA